MKFLRFLPLAVASLAFTGCADNNEVTDGTPSVKILLIDAPGDYKAVNIDLQNVQVNATTTNGEDGWQDFGVNAGKYNLLDYVAGRYAVIAEKEFPAGRIEQIRLVLGPNSTLTLKDGTTVPLKVPSGQTSGLKINLNTELQSNVTYTFVLDFDVDKSIVARGNGEYNLKPVIRAVPFALAGAIKGVVTPVAANPLVMAIRTSATPADTIATHIDANGNFILYGAKAGTYRVEFQTVAPYTSVQKENVTVTADGTTDLGVIKLN